MRTTVVTARGPVVRSLMLGPKSSIARYSKWGRWPYPYMAGIPGCPWRSWRILLSYRRIVRLTLCDTRDFLSATVRPEFASTAWKTRPCVWQWWHPWGMDIKASKVDLHMRQSRELGRGGSSGVGTWWVVTSVLAKGVRINWCTWTTAFVFTLRPDVSADHWISTRIQGGTILRSRLDAAQTVPLMPTPTNHALCYFRHRITTTKFY